MFFGNFCKIKKASLSLSFFKKFPSVTHEIKFHRFKYCFSSFPCKAVLMYKEEKMECDSAGLHVHSPFFAAAVRHCEISQGPSALDNC